MELPNKSCEHLDALRVMEPDKYVCEECTKTGDRWVHLRKCQACGVTLCCNSSPNQHASRHFHATGHPVIISAEPGEKWAYCYQDHVFNPKAY